MKKILIILTGVLLVYSEPVLANNELTGIAIAKKVSKAKKEKNTKNTKKIPSKSKKKVVSKKKVTKGTDYRSNWKTQVRWGLNYIKKRYGTPSEAWRHSQRIGWY